MNTITPIEARVLGVLVEKALTTPAQYPLTINGLITGCNQKSNRNPVMNLDEPKIIDALDSLQAKGLTRMVLMDGARMPKYRQVAKDVLEIDIRELVVLTELMLRGPQTLGEIRGRASRMHHLDDLDTVRNILDSLANRPDSFPLVKRLPPNPGSRAEQYGQLLAPDAHPLANTTTPGPSSTAAVAAAPPAQADHLHDRIAALEAEISKIKSALSTLAQSLGEADPLSPD